MKIYPIISDTRLCHPTKYISICVNDSYVYQYFTGSIILYFTELVSKVFSNLLIDMSDFPARDAVKSLCKNKCFTHRLNVFLSSANFSPNTLPLGPKDFEFQIIGWRWGGGLVFLSWDAKYPVAPDSCYCNRSTGVGFFSRWSGEKSHEYYTLVKIEFWTRLGCGQWLRGEKQ